MKSLENMKIIWLNYFEGQFCFKIVYLADINIIANTFVKNPRTQNCLNQTDLKVRLGYEESLGLLDNLFR